MVSACSATGSADEEGRAAFLPSLPPMPAMPSLPRIRFSDMRVPGLGRTAPAVDPDLEPVIRWRVIEDEILVVHADSQGCTVRSDFTVDVGSYQGDVYAVSLSRDAPDRCGEARPWGVQLAFALDELGVPDGGQVIVLNPVNEPTPVLAAWSVRERHTQIAARR